MFPIRQARIHAIVYEHQWWSVIALPFFLSKWGLLAKSYEEAPARAIDKFGGFIHLLGIYLFFRHLDYPWLTLFVAGCWQGVLGWQLWGNHFMKPLVDIEEQKYLSWPKRQVEVNVNYKTSRWFDWFFGGMQFHMEHHAWPCMPRNRLRLVSKDLRALYKKHGCDYDFDWFHIVLLRLARHNYEMAAKYKAYRAKRFAIKEE